MKRKLPVVECDICGFQQVDNGDLTAIIGLTIKQAFFTGYAGGGPVPRDMFICYDCLYGNEVRGPALLNVLVTAVFYEPDRDDHISVNAYAPLEPND